MPTELRFKSNLKVFLEYFELKVQLEVINYPKELRIELEIYFRVIIKVCI